MGVLGSMLISPMDVISDCVEKINEKYFYQPAHATIYEIRWSSGPTSVRRT